MTIEAPEHLYALSPAQDPLVQAINRLATAIERATTLTPQPPTLAPLPPVLSVNPVSAGNCSVHRIPWKIVPAGISKKTNKPYDAFLACPERGCDQRPA
jgi:hypothetical protein